jgi:hypothetical protein
MKGTYIIVWEAVRLPPKSPRHLSETLSLDEVVEGEGGEHGAVAVDIGFDEQSGAAYAVEVDDVFLVAVDVCRRKLASHSSG